MAASPETSSRRSAASSAASLKRSDGHQSDAHAIPIDTLVNHLLVAKRSLSSVNLVLRANELATTARQSHEDTIILAAETTFVRNSILDQISVLARVRRSLQNTYEWGKRDFQSLVKAMDGVDADLAGTMDMLRATQVQSVLQPSDQDGERNLLFYVDEAKVHSMREAMKQSLKDLQGIQQSFDGDLSRFETDIRNLRRNLIDSPATNKVDDIWSTATSSLLNMDDHSAAMASLLASLTKHFDMCVIAIRTTEGAAALALRKAAEVAQSPGTDGVSISGVIADQESQVSDLEPKTAEDRIEMLKVVTQDAEEVDDVVHEIQEQLEAVEAESKALRDLESKTSAVYACIMQSFALLGEIGDRLPDYMAAEEDFRQRWDFEKEGVFGRLEEMKVLKEFYEKYASAHSSLVLELARRRSVEERVQGIWRKAQEAADKLLDADRASREAFRQDVGEYLPTDLWTGMQGPGKKWMVVEMHDDEPDAANAIHTTRGTQSPEGAAASRGKGNANAG